jgi:hypothetical protein
MRRQSCVRTAIFALVASLLFAVSVSALTIEKSRRLQMPDGKGQGTDLPWMSFSQGRESAPLRSLPSISAHPSPGDTLLWDDGTRYTWAYYTASGNGWGVKFEPPYSPCTVTSLLIWLNDGWPIPGGDDLILAILDDDGPDGMPGTILYADTLLDVADLEFDAWNEIALGPSGILVNEGDFYGVYIQYDDPPNCPSIAFDEGYEENRCMAFYDGGWSPTTIYGDMLFRAKVERAGGDAHDVGMKTILAPGRDYDPLTPVTPSAVVKNYGTFPESFEVNCSISLEGSPVYDETIPVSSLAPDTPVQVDFPLWNGIEGNVYKLDFATVLGGDMTPGNDVKSSLTRNYTRTRRAVLVEGATGTWCYYCQDAALALDTLHLAAGDSVAIVEYHSSDVFANPGSNARVSYYYIDAFPTVVFDGITRVVGASGPMYSAYRMQTNADFQRKVPVDMNLEGDYDDASRLGWVRVTIDAVNGIAAGDLRLFTVLTESHIAYDWQSLDSLQFVARELFPDASGIALSLEKGDSHEETVNFQVSEAYVDSNCDIVVFLQDYASREVLGALTSPLDGLAVSVDGEDPAVNLPKSVLLSQNFPNPFNPRTQIEYSVPEGNARDVELSVFSLRGACLATLVSGMKEPGVYSVMWDGRDRDGRDLGSGVYFCRLRVGRETKTTKMLLVR